MSTGETFLVLALPDVWRTDPRYRNSGEDWDRYLTGAFIHEMTHTRTLSASLPRLRALQQRINPDSLEDDIVQDRFAKDPAFAYSVGRESDLLFRVATAIGQGERVDLAREALRLLRARRERYYVGDLTLWGELEQALLDLEGVAQWAAFMHARYTFYRLRTLRDALAVFRSGEQYWSQDEGLALYLALDALVPGWQARVLGPSPASSLELLEEAVRK